MSEERLYLHQLACEVAFRIVAADNPAVAFAKFSDDVLDEIIAGHENLAGSEGLREAFREAIGYSTRVPDALGERDERGAPGVVDSANGAVSSRSPSVLRVIDGGEA